MMKDWREKVALIADAGSDIGRAACGMLAERGAKLILCFPKGYAEPDDELKKKLEGTAYRVETPDFCSIEETQKMVSGIEGDNRFGGIDTMFFNRIPTVRRQRLADMPVEMINRLIDEDITQAFLAAKVVGESIGKNSGSMVFLGSIHDDKPTGIAPLFSMYMGALKNMVREAALYFGYKNVCCNLIELGASEGDDVVFGNDISKFYRSYKYKIPSGRIGSPEEIARLALFLMSDECRYINGAEIRTDGGLLLHYIDAVANAKVYERLGAQKP